MLSYSSSGCILSNHFYTLVRPAPSNFLASHTPLLITLYILDPLDDLLFLKLPCAFTPACLVQVVPLAKLASSPSRGKLLFNLYSSIEMILSTNQQNLLLHSLLAYHIQRVSLCFIHWLLAPWEWTLYLSHLLFSKQLLISRHSIKCCIICIGPFKNPTN